MSYFSERVLTEELLDAKGLLERAIVMLDRHGEHETACLVSEAIDRLVGAPSTLEQWYMMTGRDAAGAPRQ